MVDNKIVKLILNDLDIDYLVLKTNSYITLWEENLTAPVEQAAYFFSILSALGKLQMIADLAEDKTNA